MSTINVGHLFRKRTVRKLNGQIIDMSDEANGGAIISRGNIVNPERYEEILRKEEDKRKAAEAKLHAIEPKPEVLEQRAAQPGRIDNLEKKVADQDKKLDAILDLLTKKSS